MVIYTFDCYGTLIDWLSGAKEAFISLYPEMAEKADEFIRYWGEKDWEIVSSGIYIPYREVLRRGFKYALDRLGLEYDEETIERLTYSIYEWRPFPDVHESLKKLVENGFELGIISNTDRDFIMRSIEHIGVDFKYVIVAEDIKLYKPDPMVFVEARKRLPDDRWIHVSSYPQYDIYPALKAGVETILFDRYGYGSEIDRERVRIIYSLDELLEI